MLELQNELNQDIFSDDKAIKISYSSTKIKVRNFLTNVSYNRVTVADYKNKNFVIDCFTFLVLYLNPFYLERKFETDVEREFVNTLWAFLMPSNLYNYISQGENMKTLNKIKIKYQDAKDIILRFLEYDQANLSVLSTVLEKNAILYQFLYGNLFPKCFSRVNDYGVRAKTLFNTYYQNFNVQKSIINWQNNNLQIKEDNESTPLNLTTLDDENNEIVTENIEIKKENENNNNDNNSNDNNNENLNQKKEKKKTTRKRKIDNTEAKKRKG